MMDNFKISKLKNSSGQAATELAVFGSVLIFVLTAIITSTFGGGYSQNMQLKAMRKAMTTSFEYSEGIRGFDPEKGTASRNTASILLVEDRLSSSSAKYGSVDRIPFIVSGSATASRNLFLPPEPGEYWNLPHFDLFVNGKHFPLTTSDFGTRVFVGQDQAFFYTIIANGDSRWCDGSAASPCASNLTADQRFDLNRCGAGLDRAGLPGCPDGPVVPGPERASFGWQWYEVASNAVAEGDAVDLDRDLKEENVLRVDKEAELRDKRSKKITREGKTTITFVDSQLGDVDFTINDSDTKPSPGFATNSAQIYTRIGPGTFLAVEEGRLYSTDRQYIRTANRKDQIDLVERIFQLSNNTGRFCPGYDHGKTQLLERERNPVDVCCSAANCCFGAYTEKTCLDLTTLKLYIRSALVDRRGRKWITDTTSDDYVDFVSP